MVPVWKRSNRYVSYNGCIFHIDFTRLNILSRGIFSTSIREKKVLFNVENWLNKISNVSIKK